MTVTLHGADYDSWRDGEAEYARSLALPLSAVSWCGSLSASALRTVKVGDILRGVRNYSATVARFLERIGYLPSEKRRSLADANRAGEKTRNPALGGGRTGAARKIARAHVVPQPQDPALDALAGAVEKMLKLDFGPFAFQVGQNLSAFVDALVQAEVPVPPEGSPGHTYTVKADDPVVAPFYSELKFDRAKAKTRFENTRSAAELDMQGERESWDRAVRQYEFNRSSALATVFSTVADAGKAYKGKYNDVSPERTLNLYFTMRQATASAVLQYETECAAAAATLAAAAGNLLRAKATYVAAINAAHASRLVNEASAEETFWQSMAGARS